MILGSSYFDKRKLQPISRDDRSFVRTIHGFAESSCNKWYQRGNWFAKSVSINHAILYLSK